MKDYPIRFLAKCGAMSLSLKDDRNVKNLLVIATIK